MTSFDRILKLLFWAALIFAYVAAILPQADAPRIVPSDKLEHMIAFFTLAFLAALAWRRTAPWRIGLLLGLVGGAIELTQAIPALHRDASGADFAADCIAIVVGLIAAALIRARLSRA